MNEVPLYTHNVVRNAVGKGTEGATEGKEKGEEGNRRWKRGRKGQGGGKRCGESYDLTHREKVLCTCSRLETDRQVKNKGERSRAGAGSCVRDDACNFERSFPR